MNGCSISKHPWFVWRGPVDYCDSFSTVGRYLLQAMRRHGFPVAAHHKVFNGQKPVADVHKDLDGVKDSVPAGEKSVSVAMVPPWDFPDGLSLEPHVAYTTLETDRLAEPSLSRVAKSRLKNGAWVPSEFAKRVLIESCGATPRVIPHGVDLSRFYPVSMALSAAKPVLVFGAVAGCSPRKDFTSMVRGFRAAFEKRDDVRLEIVTNTFFHRAPTMFLQGCFKEAGVDIEKGALVPWNPKGFGSTSGFETRSYPQVAGIVLPATTPHTAIAGYLRANISAYVSTSKGEGFNMPALEAMACGKVVIMPDVGGHRDYFTPDENGIGVGTDTVSVDDKGLHRFGYTSWRQVKMADLVIAYRKAEAVARETSHPLRNNAVETARKFSWDEVAARACAALRDDGFGGFL